MAHDHSAAAHDYKADARAAYMGFIGGVIVLLVICYAIVLLTNKKFEGHAAPAASAAPTKTAPAAPH
jgi:hypothetical protein